MPTLPVNAMTHTVQNPPHDSVVNIAAYRFVQLDELEKLRAQLRAIVESAELRGTILLSPEGLNLFLAGSRAGVDQFLEYLLADSRFAEMEVKESLNNYQPFNRMLIKIKSEIISFGMPGIAPEQQTSPKLEARQLKQWLDEGRHVHLLDTRNNYEVDVGTFTDAIRPDIDNFREFPDAVSRLPETMKDEPIVMFCTGGIRCEKAGPYMEQAGFQQVYQLDGGILKYFEECGGDHYTGDCFVFDQRVAVDPQLTETRHTQCYICQEVVTPEEQESPKYTRGVSCPRCFRPSDEIVARTVAERNRQLQELTRRLPGSRPYFNRRPLNVPARYDGFTLLDFLADWHPQVPREEWQGKIEHGKIVPGQRYGRRKKRRKSAEEPIPLPVDRIVRGGERFENLLPGTVEPEVNGKLQVIHEDDQFVVINKPAPLPLHPSGRFNRNTVQYLLDQLYRPQHPLFVHRLDANTSGVLVLCRKKAIARVVAPQFEQRIVRKTYLARIKGAPADDQFVCDVPISRTPGPGGLRLPDSKNGLQAETEFTVLRRFENQTTLLEVRPLSGRTNQIRIHLAHLGLPIVGDPAWTSDQSQRSSRTLSIEEPPMCLHASAIQLTDANGELRVFRVPDPMWAVDS